MQFMLDTLDTIQSFKVKLSVVDTKYFLSRVNNTNMAMVQTTDLRVVQGLIYSNLFFL